MLGKSTEICKYISSNMALYTYIEETTTKSILENLTYTLYFHHNKKEKPPHNGRGMRGFIYKNNASVHCLYHI